MEKDSLSIHTEFNRSASEVYHAWLNSKSHSEFITGNASIQSKVGSEFMAWDGYITGEILELEKGRRILHTWRTVEFASEDEDSILEVVLEDLENGNCKFTLNQSNMPEGTKQKYWDGWMENYIEPMLEYFKS